MVYTGNQAASADQRPSQPIQQPIQTGMEVARRQVPPAAAADDDSDDDSGVGVAVHRQVRALAMVDDQGRPMVVVQENRAVVVGSGDSAVVAFQQNVHVIGASNDSPPGHRRPAIGGTNAAFRGDDDSLRQNPSVASPRNVTYNTDDDDESKCGCCCCIKWTLISILCLPCLPFICCYVCCCKDD